MYYQQLLFWAFVLVAVVGGGRYSLDYWLMQKFSASPMPLRTATVKAQVAIALFVLVVGSVAQASEAPAKVAMQELRAITQEWNGSLTYLDYTTKKPVTLVTTLHGMQATPQELLLNFVYREPNGSQVKGADKVLLSVDGTCLTWDGVPLQISSKTYLPNETLQLVLEGRGLDDKKNCSIKRTMLLSAHQFSILKEVKYNSTTVFVMRNKYEFQR
ncbi:hypothetical protein MUN86_08250 [Hymenobacter volaticus]|uniref:Uncharacterized protein n=2 Tax=Hymenobacter volaticus TaxID=2932254 RepID=A0ABY4GAP5_9BACT|nr:hypothetical protein [Hymenobacter volaticus]UOQ67835.1 hypothetical protein MUN86_08250 [Hymenobacter volaticus]